MCYFSNQPFWSLGTVMDIPALPKRKAWGKVWSNRRLHMCSDRRATHREMQPFKFIFMTTYKPPLSFSPRQDCGSETPICCFC